MLTEGAEWPAYSIPIHATIDTLENVITIIAVSGFKSDGSMSSLVKMLPLITMIKWSLALVHTTSLPVFGVYRLSKWL